MILLCQVHTLIGNRPFFRMSYDVMVLKSEQLWELKIKLEYICACDNCHARSSDMPFLCVGGAEAGRSVEVRLVAVAPLTNTLRNDCQDWLSAMIILL